MTRQNSPFTPKRSGQPFECGLGSADCGLGDSPLPFRMPHAALRRVSFRVLVRDKVNLFQPDGRLTVAGGTIIAARRQRTARANLGGVGDATALELAELEEAPGED